jgi:hypothetical protein
MLRLARMFISICAVDDSMDEIHLIGIHPSFLPNQIDSLDTAEWWNDILRADVRLCYITK